jgi:hypothetical protein
MSNLPIKHILGHSLTSYHRNSNGTPYQYGFKLWENQYVLYTASCGNPAYYKQNPFLESILFTIKNTPIKQLKKNLKNQGYNLYGPGDWIELSNIQFRGNNKGGAQGVFNVNSHEQGTYIKSLDSKGKRNNNSIKNYINGNVNPNETYDIFLSKIIKSPGIYIVDTCRKVNGISFSNPYNLNNNAHFGIISKNNLTNLIKNKPANATGYIKVKNNSKSYYLYGKVSNGKFVLLSSNRYPQNLNLTKIRNAWNVVRIVRSRTNLTKKPVFNSPLNTLTERMSLTTLS